MNDDIIKYIQGWYLSKCNGEWEHSFGFDISTLDNPGWKVTITGEKGKCAIELEIENDDNDWIFIKADNHEFSGYGGPENLTAILVHAKNWLS